MAKQYFSFAGMQRSGNHAIINWWLRHFPGYCFRNNILGISFEEKAAQYENYHPYQSNGICVDSWENYDPAAIGVFMNSTPVIAILRDPYNWWASWFAYRIPNPNVHYVPREKTIELYLNYVDYARWNYFINFNFWFSSPVYRRSIEKQWEMSTCDDGMEKIPDIGSGSTFDGMLYQGRAQEMSVLTRYKTVQHLPAYYKPLQQHPELANISREFFNMEPPEGLY